MLPLSREDRYLSWLLFLSFALALLFFLINASAFHYTGISYFPRESTPLICLGLQFAYFDRVYNHISPRSGFIIRSAAFYGLANIALAFFVSGLQFTPFPPIDEALQRWDHALHFDTAAAIAWTASHPLLRRFLDLCYMSTDVQVALAPLAAGFAFDRRRMRVYLYAFVYAFLAGGLFYYFFPSSGPGSVYQSPYFAYVQQLTSAKFYWVHHRLPVTTMWGGMIAFPSFHVMWAVIATYAALPYRKLFWGIAILNVLVIASTLLLGWHYLVDVPAGLLLGGLSLYAGVLTHRKIS
ncbi:MAG TPA: phosphatase PAP2 family protein [Elusimicrobiota bacterium]|nr:phosphatase PAP2 family protein [Elusimicrobiota bacterium]